MYDDLKQFVRQIVFSFILEKKLCKIIEQYKIKKAYSYYNSGLVDIIFVITISNTDRKLIKTSVIPPLHINGRKHKIWILFGNTGDAKTSYCSCVPATSCQHNAIALYITETFH